MVMATHLAAAVPKAALGDSIASLADHDLTSKTAFDVLVRGG